MYKQNRGKQVKEKVNGIFAMLKSFIKMMKAYVNGGVGDLEPTQLMKDAGYMGHDYVRRGLIHLDELEAVVNDAIQEQVDLGHADNIDYAHALKAIADQRATLYGLNEAHAKSAKVSRRHYRKVDSLTDWVDEDGNPKGIGPR